MLQFARYKAARNISHSLNPEYVVYVEITGGMLWRVVLCLMGRVLTIFLRYFQDIFTIFSRYFHDSRLWMQKTEMMQMTTFNHRENVVKIS